MSDFIHLAPIDTVLVLLRDARDGETVGGIALRQNVGRGHKIARVPIAAGERVVKFGYPIGIATQAIAPGEWVHGHNLRTALSLPPFPPPSSERERGEAGNAGGVSDKTFGTFEAAKETRVVVSASPLSRSDEGGGKGGREIFAYRRKNGGIGIRNEVWIINTVGCVNVTSERIAFLANRRFAGPGKALDGVYAFSHPFGCSQLGDDLANTQKLLAALACHPNAAGVLVLGLGCENNQLRDFLEVMGENAADRVRFFNAQDVGDEIEAGVEAVGELAEYAATFKREPVPASELILGMKCGGSDGLSGITANPLVGRIADRLAEAGGTVLLTEVPEMFGAEQVLLSRAHNETIFDKTTELINDFKDYFHKHDQPIFENPSPGNKEGGITTLEEKSLGCVQKGGTVAPVVDVLPYGSVARAGKGGITLLNAPGNDAVSSTVLAAGGAHMVLFTTGRGTPLGVPVPTLKISTNTPLAEKKPHWIDFDAGQLLQGVGMDEMADDLWAHICAVASGEKTTKNEENSYREIALWKAGVTL